jgi:glycosyltransferase involved in cell wall biosynthesis
MLFSILIANYNNARYLGTALASLQAQTCQDWEAILVDDASTDDFEEVISVWREDKRIKVFRNQRNEGCGYTKRRCVELASGSLLAFLDPDDALDPEALAIMEQAHALHPECSLIHSTHYICDAQLQVKRIAGYPRALPKGMPYLLLNDGSIHHFATFKKACYSATEGLSPVNRAAVDQDLYYKLEETGDVLYIDKPLYYYRIHEGAISNAGKERNASLWHYSIIMDACQRRMKHVGKLRKTYRARYYKARIFRSFRKRKYADFLYSLMIFPFAGGWENLVSYSRKLPKEGIGLIRRSLVDDYEIKV